MITTQGSGNRPKCQCIDLHRISLSHKPVLKCHTFTPHKFLVGFSSSTKETAFKPEIINFYHTY